MVDGIREVVLASLVIAGARSWVDVFEGTVDVAGCRVCDVLPGLDLVAAGDESRLSGVEQGLGTVPRREGWLARALHGHHDAYDDVIIDCPPSLGQLTTNALLVADRIVAPPRPRPCTPATATAMASPAKANPAAAPARSSARASPRRPLREL